MSAIFSEPTLQYLTQIVLRFTQEVRLENAELGQGDTVALDERLQLKLRLSAILQTYGILMHEHRVSGVFPAETRSLANLVNALRDAQTELRENVSLLKGRHVTTLARLEALQHAQRRKREATVPYGATAKHLR